MEPVAHNGRVITDEEIQAMADEAEAGYDLSTLKRLPGLHAGYGTSEAGNTE